ncbi:MAG: hypothetical protein VB133_05150, partial [Anaeromusa sp.]|uniref:hypothetical protein n=1 Tax=Anaeromusa sp. TaxID=1872520 RepID=UPI002B21D996
SLPFFSCSSTRLYSGKLNCILENLAEHLSAYYVALFFKNTSYAKDSNCNVSLASMQETLQEDAGIKSLFAHPFKLIHEQGIVLAGNKHCTDNYKN